MIWLITASSSCSCIYIISTLFLDMCDALPPRHSFLVLRSGWQRLFRRRWHCRCCTYIVVSCLSVIRHWPSKDCHYCRIPDSYFLSVCAHHSNAAYSSCADFRKFYVCVKLLEYAKIFFLNNLDKFKERGLLISLHQLPPI